MMNGLSGTLNDQATSVLRERILDGSLKAGSRVLEIELAGELGISRGTLRAALQQLSFEGLVIQNRFRSTYVTSLTAKDVYEIYTIRNTLEAMAASLAARNIGDAGRERLDACIHRMNMSVEKDHIKGVVEADYELHRCILALSGHSRLQTHYRLIEPQTRLYLQLTSKFDYDLPWILDIHRDIVAAIKDGDAIRAEALSREHNTIDGERLTRFLSENPDTDSVQEPNERYPFQSETS